MPEFGIGFRYTPAAWTALVNAPTDGTDAVAATVAEAGGRLRDIWCRVEDLSGLAVLRHPTRRRRRSSRC